MRIVIATVQVPFVKGGAEEHASGLATAFRKDGHEVDICSIPFKWYPPERILDHMLAARLLDLTESSGVKIDLLVGLKFPAYLIPHPHKVLWIIHQHRAAYEMWRHPVYGDLAAAPNGRVVRDAIRGADMQLIPEARAIFANSARVSQRLRESCGIESKPLYHPPPCAELFFCAPAEEYFFFPSRISPPKRQGLVLEALGLTRHPVRVMFAGEAETASYGEALRLKAKELNVENRAVWLGRISQEEKLGLYAKCKAVVFPPWDEDYGYVTLEAMLSSKPVITCSDSGGPLEFVLNEQTGLVTAPEPMALAMAMDRLWEDSNIAAHMGVRGRARYDSLNIRWEDVAKALIESMGGSSAD